ncbi:MAG: hypothetical protein ACOH12_04590 [Parvibaculaceae bacterium]
MYNYISKPVLILLGLICLCLAATDFFVTRHASLHFTATPLFYCGLGFIAYAALIFMAKALRPLISRPENYYGRESIDAEDRTTQEVKHD